MTLTDAGPLIALVDRGDANHDRCMETLKQLPFASFVTTWPCLTEAMHLLGKSGGPRYQADLWKTWQEGRLILRDLTTAETGRVRDLMAQYSDVPMDLADASIVAVAESDGYTKVFSIDTDFRFYRLANGHFLEVVP